MGTILGTILEVSSQTKEVQQTLILKYISLINFIYVLMNIFHWMLLQWTSKNCVPFTYQKYFWVQIHFKVLISIVLVIIDHHGLQLKMIMISSTSRHHGAWGGGGGLAHKLLFYPPRVYTNHANL